MNQHAKSSNNPDEIRSEINTTRERMDNTIDELAERIKGRHLLDEVLGYFRSPGGSAKAGELKQKMGHTAGSAVHSVMSMIKSNPGPAAVIGAGIGWMIYNASSNRSSSDLEYEQYGDEEFGDPGFYEGGGASYHPSHAYRPGEANPYGYGFDESDGESGEGLKDKIGQRARKAREKMGDSMSHLGSRARDRAEAMKHRAGEVGSQFQERTHRLVGRGRERMVQSVDEHPLGIGLGCLALGIIAGLALPTPPKVNEFAGERADRLRRRAREAGQEYVEKGKHVIHAAADAVKEEARSQGITPESLREKAGAVADRAKSTARETAREEGVLPKSAGEGKGQGVEKSSEVQNAQAKI